MYDRLTLPARADIPGMYLDLEAKYEAKKRQANRLSAAVGILLALCIGLSSAVAFAVDVALQQKPAIIVVPFVRPAAPPLTTYDRLVRLASPRANGARSGLRVEAA